MNDIIFKSSYVNPKYESKFLTNSKKLSKCEKWQQWNSFQKACNEGDENQVKCWQDFEYYRKQVCKHETYPHQKTWENLLITGKDSEHLKGIAGKDLLILAPRGGGKSSFIIEWVAYQLGIHTAPWNRISPRILYISYDMSTAQSKSRQIQSIILTKQYQDVFPWVKPSSTKWGEREWAIDFKYAGLSSTNEQYTLAAGGLRGAINSRRASLVIADDLYKSLEDATSDAIGDKLRSNWNQVIRFTRFYGSRAVCVGTRFSAKDLYNDLFTQDNGWHVCEQSAIVRLSDGTEKSYWQDGQPLSMLQSERATDPVSFSFQRQNKIIRVSEQSISPELIVKDWLPTKFDVLCIGCDLSAGTKQSNDFTTLVLGGRRENNFYIVDCWENRVMGNLEKLRAISELWENWNHLLPTTKSIDYQTGMEYESYFNKLRIWFDSSAYGLSFEGDFKDYKRENKLNDWEVFGLSASGRGSKLERLRRHTKLFEDKQIKFNIFGDNRKMEDGRIPFNRLIQQLTDFGNTRHDDLADAFDLCVIGLRANNYSKLSKGNY
ncbi:MAG: hypothetical protein WBA07_20265 [Rivularia sp. (in: cyanobacteria)]